MNCRDGSVLVVEDVPDVRELAAEFLRLAGFSVDCAANGQQALEYLDTHPRPALIILDLEMPVMDGYEFLERQSREPRFRDIPILLYSNEAASARRLRSPSVVGTIEKTAGRSIFLAAVSGAQPVERNLLH